MTIGPTDEYSINFFISGIIIVLSIEQAKKTLGKDSEFMTDNEIQDLLDFLYCICNIVYNKNGLNKPNIDA